MPVRAVSLVFFLDLASFSTAYAQPPSAKTNPVELVVTSATANLATDLVTIDGVNFGSARPVVRLGTQNLTVASWSDTQIIATLPADLPAGTYRLVVTRNNSAVGSGAIDLTIRGSWFDRTTRSARMPRDHKGRKVLPVFRDQQGRPVALARKVPPGPLVLKERLGRPVRWVSSDHRDCRAVSRERRGRRATLAMRVQGPPGTLVRTVIVSPDPGDFVASGQTLLAALNGINGAASASDPWLLRIERGIYDLGNQTLTMRPFIDIEEVRVS